MASFSHGALNLVHRSSPSNTAISSSCGFHLCSLREPDVILHHRILPVLFCLAAQNNPVVIDLRYSFGSTLESNHNTCLIGHNWFTCFKRCNPEISGIWIRQITSFQFKAATQEVIKPWFDAIAEICSEYRYPPKHHYNMDESRFAVGVSQSSKIIINIHKKQKWKVILIFKAKHKNLAWSPSDTPLNWQFSTSFGLLVRMVMNG